VLPSWPGFPVTGTCRVKTNIAQRYRVAIPGASDKEAVGYWPAAIGFMKPESERNQTLRRPSTETSLVEEMLTAKEVATEMKISTSWLAKRRMDGDGPPYIKVGRSIRYMRTEIMQWMRSRQRM